MLVIKYTYKMGYIYYIHYKLFKNNNNNILLYLIIIIIIIIIIFFKQ